MTGWRRYVVVLMASALVGCGSATQKSLTSQPQQMQTVVITSQSASTGVADTLRFGRMRSGEIVVKNLRVENRSGEPIVLLRHTTTCGCIKPTYERRPVADGQSVDIALEFDSRTMYGWQMKLMEFYFAEKGKPLKVYAEAEVE